MAQIKTHIVENHENNSMIRIKHQKLRRDNPEEVSSRTHWRKDIFENEIGLNIHEYK